MGSPKNTRYETRASFILCIWKMRQQHGINNGKFPPQARMSAKKEDSFRILTSRWCCWLAGCWILHIEECAEHGPEMATKRKQTRPPTFAAIVVVPVLLVGCCGFGTLDPCCYCCCWPQMQRRAGVRMVSQYLLGGYIRWDRLLLLTGWLVGWLVCMRACVLFYGLGLAIPLKKWWHIERWTASPRGTDEWMNVLA